MEQIDLQANVALREHFGATDHATFWLQKVICYNVHICSKIKAPCLKKDTSTVIFCGKICDIWPIVIHD